MLFSSRKEEPPSPPLQTKVTIVGKNEIYNQENLVGPFLVHKILGPSPPLPSPHFKHTPALSPALASHEPEHTSQHTLSRSFCARYALLCACLALCHASLEFPSALVGERSFSHISPGVV